MGPMGIYGFYLGVLGATNDPEIRGYVEPKYNLILAIDRKTSLLHEGNRAASDMAPELIDYKIVGAKIHALYKRDTWYRDDAGFIPLYEHKAFDSKKKVANPGQIHLAVASVAPHSDKISEEEAQSRFRDRVEGKNLYDFEYESEAGRWRVKTESIEGSITTPYSTEFDYTPVTSEGGQIVTVGFPKNVSPESEVKYYQPLFDSVKNDSNWKGPTKPVSVNTRTEADLMARSITHYVGGAEVKAIAGGKFRVESKGYYHYMGG